METKVSGYKPLFSVKAMKYPLISSFPIGDCIVITMRENTDGTDNQALRFRVRSFGIMDRHSPYKCNPYKGLQPGS